jgi:hypothetical protein
MAKPKYAGVPGFNIDTDDAPAPSPTKPDEKTVVLRGVRVLLNSDVGGAFITDCARNRERLFSDDQIREKYEIDDNAWGAITQNKALRLLVNAECERRMLNNDAAREAAAKFFTQAPSVLNGILQDPKAPPRQRIEASKELRATARAGDERPGDTSDRVIISINLGADVKPIVVDSGPLPPKRVKEDLDAE